MQKFLEDIDLIEEIDTKKRIANNLMKMMKDLSKLNTRKAKRLKRLLSQLSLDVGLKGSDISDVNT